MKKFLSFLAICVTASILPVAGLIALSIWVFMVSPMIFGILFVGAATMAIAKNIVIALAAMAIVSAIAVAAMVRKSDATIEGESKRVADIGTPAAS